MHATPRDERGAIKRWAWDEKRKKKEGERVEHFYPINGDINIGDRNVRSSRTPGDMQGLPRNRHCI